jgi:hypothetical protein
MTRRVRSSRAVTPVSWRLSTVQQGEGASTSSLPRDRERRVLRRLRRIEVHWRACVSFNVSKRGGATAARRMCECRSLPSRDADSKGQTGVGGEIVARHPFGRADIADITGRDSTAVVGWCGRQCEPEMNGRIRVIASSRSCLVALVPGDSIRVISSRNLIFTNVEATGCCGQGCPWHNAGSDRHVSCHPA